MDILLTGAIECRHAAGECRECCVRRERRCLAPQQETCVEDCTCPRQESLETDPVTGRYRPVSAVYSHDCPIHGAPLEPPAPKVTGPWTCVDCGTPNQMLPEAQGLKCPRCLSTRLAKVRG